jgi:acetyltransferase-like isoleucine patch superfamily enzyme
VKNIFQKALFKIKFEYISKYICYIRGFFYQIQGMTLGRGTPLPKINITWPHQVEIGKNCVLEKEIFFKYDGIWKEGPSLIIGNNVFIGTGVEFNITKGINIGNDCLIASGCRFIDHDHGIALTELMRNQDSVELKIAIHDNVWIGCNCVILKGVEIESGAIIAAGAVVTKSVGSNEIWAGIPAKKIGLRKS